jgi:hypothetical protein
MVNRILAVASLVVVAAAVAASTMVQAAPSPEPAVVITDVSCLLYDGAGMLTVVTMDTHGVITNSSNDNRIVRCQADVAPPPNGRAVQFSQDTHPAIQCSALGRLTDDWRQTVSASGKATLQCRFKE